MGFKLGETKTLLAECFCFAPQGHFHFSKPEYRQEKLVIERTVLAPTYSPLASTIGSGGLNCRVRNEDGCTPADEAPTQYVQSFLERLILN